ncbi:hypothetical protein KQI84_12060 [bacterium]|nr:hypothetical protein [bacterium]
MDRLIIDEGWTPQDSPEVLCYVASDLRAYMDFPARLLHHRAMSDSSVTWQLGSASLDRLAGLDLDLNPDLDSQTISKTLVDVDGAFPNETPNPFCGDNDDGMGIVVEFTLPDDLSKDLSHRWLEYLAAFEELHAERFGPLWQFVKDWKSPDPNRFTAEIPYRFSDWRNVRFRAHFLERYGAEKLGTETPFIVSLFGVRPDAVPYASWILMEIAAGLGGRILIPSAD